MSSYYRTDYHIHSKFTLDCEMPLEMIYQYAAKTGIQELGITDIFSAHPNDPHFSYLDLDEYFDYLEKFIQSLPDEGPVVRRGLEVDYQPRYAKRIRAALADRRVDYFLLAVHYVDGLKCTTAEYFQVMGLKEAYQKYFAALADAIETGLFQVVGHFDVPKWFGVTIHGDFKLSYYLEEVDAILAEMAKRDMALEINTSGYHLAPRDTFPSMEVVERFMNQGGKYLTLGSDAKMFHEIADQDNRVLSQLQERGFSKLLRLSMENPS